MSPGSCNHDRAPEYFAESIYSEQGFWGFRCGELFYWLFIPHFTTTKDCAKVNEMTFFIIFHNISAHWYLYALGFCKEEDSDSIAEMGYNADSE